MKCKYKVYKSKGNIVAKCIEGGLHDMKGTLHKVVKGLHEAEKEGHKVACEIRGQGLQRDFMKKLKEFESMPPKAVKAVEETVEMAPAKKNHDHHMQNPMSAVIVADCNSCGTGLCETDIAYEEPGTNGATVCGTCLPSFKAAKNPGVLSRLEHHASQVKSNLQDYTESLMNNPMPDDYTFEQWAETEAGKHGDNITFKDWAKEEDAEFLEQVGPREYEAYGGEIEYTGYSDMEPVPGTSGFSAWAESEMEEETHTHSDGTTHTHKNGNVKHTHRRANPKKNSMMYWVDEASEDIEDTRSNPLRMNGKMKELIHEYSHAVSDTEEEADKLMNAILDGKIPHLTAEKMNKEINKVSGLAKVRRNPMDFEQFVVKGSKGRAQRKALAQMHKCPETIVDEIIKYSQTGLQDDSLTAYELWAEWCSPTKLTA
jgi:hypothetical protein